MPANALADTAPSGTNEPDYAVDNTAPTVTSIEQQSPSSSPTNADSLTWRVTFGENVKAWTPADFAVRRDHGDAHRERGDGVDGV